MQINVEYWFRLLYECLFSECRGSADASQFSAWIAHLWLWIIVIGYLAALIALVVIVYSTVRLFELRKREDEYYDTLIPMPGAEEGRGSRWQHIETLTESTEPNDWRTAIIEADIMLDDLLTKLGYLGMGVGEKLKLVERSRFSTLDSAWEAHKVRNQIAHQGSTFELTQTLARRTIGRYEAVFREFNIL